MQEEMRARCPACGGEGGRVVGRKADWALVRCPVCRLVHSHPPPVERVRTKYLEEYDLAAHFDAFADRKRVLYERRLARLPRPQPAGNRLCDVGCAGGQFLDLARAHGWATFGVEMNPPAAARARGSGAVIFEGRVEELDALPWETFDLVTSWDALEHTPCPLQFVERLVRLLKPGGTLALTTLNHRSLAWAVFGTRWSMVVDDHFTYWTSGSLRRLLDRAGLRILDVDIFGIGRDFASVLGRLRGHRTTARPAPSTPASFDTRGSVHPEPVGASTAPLARSSGGWDVSPRVLRAEAVVNAVLRMVGGGVGIGMTAQKSTRRDSPGSAERLDPAVVPVRGPV